MVAQNRIFLHQTLEGMTDLLLVAPRLRLDGEADNRFRRRNRVVHDGVRFIAQRIPGLCFFQLHRGAEIPSLDLGDRLRVLALQERQGADSLHQVLAGIEVGGVRFEDAAHHAKQGDASCVRVGNGLEDEG